VRSRKIFWQTVLGFTTETRRHGEKQARVGKKDQKQTKEENTKNGFWLLAEAWDAAQRSYDQNQKITIPSAVASGQLRTGYDTETQPSGATTKNQNLNTEDILRLTPQGQATGKAEDTEKSKLLERDFDFGKAAGCGRIHRCNDL